MRRISRIWLIGVASAFSCALVVGCAKPSASSIGRIALPPIDKNNNRPFDVCKAYVIALSHNDSEKAQSLRSQFFRKKVDANPEAAAEEQAAYKKRWAEDSYRSFTERDTTLAEGSSSVWKCVMDVGDEEGRPRNALAWEYAIMEDGVWRVANRYEADAEDAAEQSNAADSR